MDPRDAEPQDRLPVNYEAEQALLGAILSDNRAYDKVCDTLRAEHFADGVHQRIFEACAKEIEQGRVANAVTLKTQFERDEALAEVGGAEYLAKLQISQVTIINAKDYARTITDLWMRREYIEIAELGIENIRLGGADYRGDAAAVIEEVGVDLAGVTEAGAGETQGRSFPILLEACYENVEAARKSDGISGVPTGLATLDARLGGLQPSDLIILAGRPSMGKTSLAINAALNAAQSGKSVLVLSLEMSDEQLTARILGGESGVSADAMRRGDVTDRQFDAIMDCGRGLHGLPISIEGLRHPTVQACAAKARRLKRQRGLDLIIIDYLQLMTDPRRRENRVQEVSAMTRDLKKMAGDLNVPVVVLSQLSRKVEERDDKRPIVSDLRESGTIEQDADIIIFLYREYEYLKKAMPRQRDRETGETYSNRMSTWRARMEETRGIAEVIIAKQRHGPTFNVTLHFDAKRTKFSDRDDDSSTPHQDQELDF